MFYSALGQFDGSAIRAKLGEPILPIGTMKCEIGAETPATCRQSRKGTAGSVELRRLLNCV